MSKLLKKHGKILRYLSKLPESKRRSWIKKNCSKDLVNCICECSLNVLKGNVRLTPAQKKKLARCKSSLRTLVSKKTSLKRRQAIIQKGGFLGALLGPIASFLGGLLLK